MDFPGNPCFIVRGYICNPTPSLLNPQENPWFSIRSIHELGPSHGITSHTGNLTQLWMLWCIYDFPIEHGGFRYVALGYHILT